MSAPQTATQYQKGLAERSSYVENVLTHLLVGALASELWRRDPTTPLNIFNSEVDDSGFDLVLSCNQNLRYLQIKQVHLNGRASKFSVRHDFSLIMGSCVVVIVHAADDLSIDHYLFFGGSVNEPMPSINGNKASISPGRRGADGTRKVRQHYRDIRRSKFKKLMSVSELVDALFG